jgi:hypothetical protein
VKRVIAFSSLAASATMASAQVFPSQAHVTGNFIPFGQNQTATHHQVFASSLFSSATGGLPAHIHSIGFAPTAGGTYNGNITLRLGYTNAIPGQSAAAGGLNIPTAGGGGGPNAVGAMHTFYSNPDYTLTITAPSPANFSEFKLPGSWIYNPAQGNLLVEIVSIAGPTLDLAVSRTSGSAESSRAYTSTRFTPAASPTTALRMEFGMTPVPEPATMLALAAGVGAVVARRRRRS